MKRFLRSIIISCVIMLSLCVSASAVESNIDTYYDEFDFSSVLDSLNSETTDILSEIGITDVSIDSLFNISPQKIFDALFNILNNALKKPVGFLFISIGILTISALMGNLTKENKSVEIIGGSALTLSLCVPIANIVTTAFSVLEALLIFTTAFTGVFCAVVSSSGNISLGTSYASLTVFFDTVFSGLIVNLSQPLVNSMCALGFLSCFDFYDFTQRFSGIIKKIYVFFLSLLGSAFSGLITLKGILGSSTDSLSSRGIRFIIGQSLPVVGGAVSESYLTLTQSLSLIKNTVGVFGIITVVVFILPTLLSLLGWILVLELTTIVANSMGITVGVNMVNVIKDSLVLLVSTIVILTTVFIVSVGIAIAAKGGAL